MKAAGWLHPAAATAACEPCSAVVSEHVQRLASSHQLTVREVQVVRHVACGASNSEVAAHLGVSVRTIDCHLRNAYRKLNIHSRVHLALLVHNESV